MLRSSMKVLGNRAHWLCASLIIGGVLLAPASASATVTVLEPANESVVVGPNIHFKVQVDSPGCQEGGSEGALQVWMVSSPNYPSGIGGYGDWGQFSSGSPAIYEWDSEDFYGEYGGYGTWKLRVDLTCKEGVEDKSQVVTFTLAPPGTVVGGGGGGGKSPAQEQLAKEIAESCAKVQGHVAEIGRIAKEADEGTEPLEKLSAANFLIASVLEKSGEVLAESPNPVAKPYAVLLGVTGAFFDTYSNIGDVGVAKFKADAQRILDSYDQLRGELAKECGSAFSLPEVKLKKQIPLTQYYTIAKHALGDSPLFLRPGARHHSPTSKGEELATKLRAGNAALEASGKKYGAALSALGKSLTADGAPGADLETTQKTQAKLASVIKRQTALTKLLPASVKNLTISKEALPQQMRDKPIAKKLEGLTIGKLLSSPELAKAQAQWLGELRQPLPFPIR